jgi:hypothetical protein
MDDFQLVFKEHLQKARKDKLDNNALWWQGGRVGFHIFNSTNPDRKSFFVVMADIEKMQFNTVV